MVPKKPQFPVFCSPRPWGVPVIVLGSKVVDPVTHEATPSPTVQRYYGWPELNGLLGMLCVGKPCLPATKTATQRALVDDSRLHVITQKAHPLAVFFYVLDCAEPTLVFHKRLAKMKTRLQRVRLPLPHFSIDENPNVVCSPLQLVETELANNTTELREIQKRFWDAGYQNHLLRGPFDMYKGTR